MKKVLKVFLIVILILLIALFLLRSVNPKEIDDIHPNRFCEQEYIEKSDILWVMPMYENISIAKNKTWCSEILKLNKTLGMHGITHEFHEFSNTINESELIFAKSEFKSCFGYEPTLFKPPYLRLSYENKIMLEKNNFTIKKYFNQNTHKVYHCQNSGTFPNWFHDIF